VTIGVLLGYLVSYIGIFSGSVLNVITFRHNTKMSFLLPFTKFEGLGNFLYAIQL